MAQQHIVRLIDDIDGLDADETVTFSLDGTHYEIDLTAQNAAKLRDALAVFIASARRVGRPAGRAGGSGSSGGTGSAPRRGSARTSRVDTSVIREWARNNGHQVGDKGRIPVQVLEAYEARQRT